MAFRFFRRFRVAPGITLNLSKSGPSLSFGPRGAKMTIGSKGIRRTLGLPGTGLFYTEHSPWSSSGGRHRSSSRGGQPHVPVEDRLTLGFFKRLVTPRDERAFVDGLKAFVQGRESCALKQFRASLNLGDSAFMAGFLALKKLRFQEALETLQLANQRHGSLGRLFGKYGVHVELVLPISRELEAHIGPRRRGLLLGMAEAYQAMDEHLRAAETLIELRDMMPDDIVIKASLAELLLDAGSDDPKTHHEIVRMAGDVTNESPAHAVLMLYKAKALRAQGLHTAARDTLTAALRPTKDRGKDLLLALRYERALVYSAMNQHKRSRTELEKVYAQDAEYEDVVTIKNLQSINKEVHMPTAEINETIESSFHILPPEEKTAVITHGVAVRFSELNNRHFLAQSKIRFFEEKYKKTLSDIEKQGLPDDADYEMHEDYVMWCHWSDTMEKVKRQISILKQIAELGVYR
jgi:tetratricopeptide (TPR) repeat protein